MHVMVVYAWAVWLIFLLVAGTALLAWRRAVIVGKIMLTAAIGSFVLPGIPSGALYVLLAGGVRGGIYALITVLALVILTAICCCALWGALKNRIVPFVLFSALALCAVSGGGVALYDAYTNSIPTVAETNVIDPYRPYGEGSVVAELDTEPSLRLSDNLPYLDGATALWPVYSAFAKAVYPKEAIDGEHLFANNILLCTKTGGAYDRITHGDADIIFVAAPSEQQKKEAEECGAELCYTPIGKEAFVFFVNSKNPLDNITTEQIRGIYSGKITGWKELGVGNMGKIRAFQRDEGSGSQSALVRLMGGVPLAEPPTEDVVDGMAGIISRTADYKNYKNAIGYSFRFYSTEMIKNGRIKLLSVDGVPPTLENIGNGTYPLTSEFYAVTRGDASENTKKMLSWITSPQGMSLVEKTGYIPIK